MQLKIVLMDLSKEVLSKIIIITILDNKAQAMNRHPKEFLTMSRPMKKMI